MITGRNKVLEKSIARMLTVRSPELATLSGRLMLSLVGRLTHIAQPRDAFSAYINESCGVLNNV